MKRFLDYRNIINRRHSLNRGLVSEWVCLPTLAGGRTLYDIVGRNHGTLVNNTSWFSPYGRNVGYGSLRFLSTLSQYVTTPLQNVGYANGTISWWMRPSLAHNDGTIHGWWGHITAFGTFPGFDAQKFSDNNFYVGFFGTADDDRVVIAASAENYTIGVWQHYAFTWVSGGDSLLYRNGVLIGTKSGGTTVRNIAVNFEIGRENINNYFTGLMDEFAVRNVTLSAVQVQQLYNESCLGNLTRYNWIYPERMSYLEYVTKTVPIGINYSQYFNIQYQEQR